MRRERLFFEWMRMSIPKLIFYSALLSIGSATSSLFVSGGGEKVFFETVQMTPNITHRQSVCDRYEMFNNGEIELKDALDGVEIRPLVGAYDGAFFNYDPENGIDREYPGLAATIMDELARRGKFTWRNSFGVYYNPSDYNHSWSAVLLWGIDTYDLIVDWWAVSIERMQLGVVFLKEWQDSSIMLIKKKQKEEISDEINFWNWLRPYDWKVWALTILTIVSSGLVYQTLEWLADERNDRSLWEWSLENLYLSLINFTQVS